MTMLRKKMISYEDAPDIRAKIESIIAAAGLAHIKQESLTCMRSRGTNSRRVIARCHALPRIMQKALGAVPHYVIEIVSERFDKLSEEERTKTLIHELMHIPKAFGGGFVHHNMVNAREVEKVWKKIAKGLL
ncbi:metallopeptidase [Candidatus Desantisbacteria bacterium CG_4_10_14_0_8_um_filter_48_22]|uniref:Metallopeptidase n=1 Tax=Candidatus Desantisbacteria bacterium CG_4_10_14_0_8_um_filter_48_22 TaxID=1974543 RepID=A0A2M7SA30_9BACT|nr:MAG: metallopeptidase [Candidatus Desantisbacteria bacterium CG_4_10_14_0_8_um_filter_48_22]